MKLLLMNLLLLRIMANELAQRGGKMLSCENCSYRFECEHADKYYIPEEKDEE